MTSQVIASASQIPDIETKANQYRFGRMQIPTSPLRRPARSIGCDGNSIKIFRGIVTMQPDDPVKPSVKPVEGLVLSVSEVKRSIGPGMRS
jgi:hypothetical protein